MVTVASDTVLTRPVPERLKALGWDGEVSVCDSRRRLNYYRTTPDGRLLFGKGGSGVAPGSSAPAPSGATPCAPPSCAPTSPGSSRTSPTRPSICAGPRPWSTR
ncbi:hypothetical protein AB6O49_26620 [Streptomyces sp. SBR177]